MLCGYSKNICGCRAHCQSPDFGQSFDKWRIVGRAALVPLDRFASHRFNLYDRGLASPIQQILQVGPLARHQEWGCRAIEAIQRQLQHSGRQFENLAAQGRNAIRVVREIRI